MQVKKGSLNPCCNGIYLIISGSDYRLDYFYKSLNPCCNGIYLIISLTLLLEQQRTSLNPCCNGIYLIIF